MAAENSLRVKITADDRASAVIEKMKSRLGSVETPANRASKAMRGLTERTDRLERFARGRALPDMSTRFRDFARHSFDAFRNVSRLSGELEGLAGLMDRLGPLGVAISGGLLAKRWADQGLRLKNEAANIGGVSMGQLMRYRRIAQGVGVSGESITSDIRTLRNDQFDAGINHKGQMYQAFRQPGIPLRDKNGQWTALPVLMNDLATKLQTLSPIGQQRVLSAMGLDPASMPFFRLSPAEVAARNAALKREGLTSSAYTGAGALYRDFTELDSAAIVASNRLGKDFAPAVGYATKALSSFLLNVGTKKGVVYQDGAWLPDWIKAFRQWNSPTPGTHGVARSLRDNNPLNLTYLPGQAGVVGRDGRFGRYGTMADGVSAAVNQIMIDRSRGMNTIRKLVTSWAPPGENDTAAYIRDVSKWTGYGPDQPLNLRNPRVMSAIVAAMARQEGSGRLAPSDLASGVLGGYREFANGAPRALPASVTSELARLRAAHGGSVKVDINHNNAPAGATVRATAAGSASIGTLRVVRAMTPAEAYP